MITLTISQLNRYVKSVLEEDNNLQDMYLKAEVSNFKYHSPSGHMYMTLKDEKATIRGVMFKGYAEHLRFMPEDGMSVIVRGDIGVYEKDGAYQVYITDIQPDGTGAIAIAVRQLYEKLEAQGLFDSAHKKELPLFPQRIGVITAETGAALADITQVLSRRYPIGTMVLCPALVQGKEAPASLINAVEALDNKCDVIIIGRGGGSVEDLWAFQDEMLARAIFLAKTPIISAVGHEVDTTICDMVADLRAPTPSAAAELAVPSKEQLQEYLLQQKEQLVFLGKKELEEKQKRVASLANHAALKYAGYTVMKQRERLDFLAKNMYNIRNQSIERKKQKIGQLAAMLDSLSPFAVLGRGYSVVLQNKKPVRSIKELAKNDRVQLLLKDGIANAIIHETQVKDFNYGEETNL